MMHSDLDQRPSAIELLSNFLQSEIEIELQYEKYENRILKKKIQDIESKLKIVRKNSV